jgi:DNA-binding Xre family transcriptional regulator
VTDSECVNATSLLAAHIASGYPRLELDSTVGKNLIRIRGERDQQEIAKRMGWPSSRLSNLERDRYKGMAMKTLLRLATAYECSVEEIVAGVMGYRGPGLSHQGSTVGTSPGGADDPASARLLEELDAVSKERDAYKTALSQVSNVAVELGSLVARIEEIGDVGTDKAHRGKAR